MDNQDLTQMPTRGEDQNDAGPEIDGWSVFGAILLGAGFVIHMMFSGIGDGPTHGLRWRLQFYFVLLGGVAICAMALAGLIRIRKPGPNPPAAQDLGGSEAAPLEAVGLPAGPAATAECR
jgi:hypothetical protein